ncbi:potassium channel family protein [Streptomyces sp. NPDC047000]|uniref:potassium channel family protein n=1 Tax=Streptomyces sp. NPDC047000 TaxID=3155474 RepID=UPI0033D12CD8
MSDPTDARPDPARPDPDAYPPGQPARPSRRATVAGAARAVGFSAGLLVAYYLLPLDDKTSAGAWILLIGGLLAVVLVFGAEIKVVVGSPYPRLRAVEALSVTLVLFLVIFAGVYHEQDRTTPGSFSEPLTRTDALYFTLTTFATVGFGDITARTEAARVIVMLQMTGGLLLVGVAARVLLAAVDEGLRRRTGKPEARTGPEPEPEPEPDDR